MTNPIAKISPLVLARITGFLYLLPFAPFSMVYIPSHLIVPGDAAATASKIRASESLFRLGIVSNLASQVTFLFIGLLLYQLLKSVNKKAALLMVILNLVGIPIVMLAELNQFAVLELLHDAKYLTGFTPDQLHALMYLFLNLRADGLSIAGIFWSLWLFPMGYLVFKSGFFPRIIGVLLIIAGFGYLIQYFGGFLGYDLNIIFYTGLGEGVFALWLLIRGLNPEKWEKRALESA